MSLTVALGGVSRATLSGILASMSVNRLRSLQRVFRVAAWVTALCQSPSVAKVSTSFGQFLGVFASRERPFCCCAFSFSVRTNVASEQ